MNSLSKKIMLISGLVIFILIAYVFINMVVPPNSGLAAEQFCSRLVDTIAGWSGRGSKNSLADDLTLLVVEFETVAT
jgi:hypothetical protein